jgi:hypothetical protein
LLLHLRRQRRRRVARDAQLVLVGLQQRDRREHRRVVLIVHALWLDLARLVRWFSHRAGSYYPTAKKYLKFSPECGPRAPSDPPIASQKSPLPAALPGVSTASWEVMGVIYKSTCEVSRGSVKAALHCLVAAKGAGPCISLPQSSDRAVASLDGS